MQKEPGDGSQEIESNAERIVDESLAQALRAAISYHVSQALRPGRMRKAVLAGLLKIKPGEIDLLLDPNNNLDASRLRRIYSAIEQNQLFHIPND